MTATTEHTTNVPLEHAQRLITTALHHTAQGRRDPILRGILHDLERTLRRVEDNEPPF